MGMVDLTFPRSKTAKQKTWAANQSWIVSARAPLPPISCPHTASASSCSERVSRCVLGARYDDRIKKEDGFRMNEWVWGVQHSKDSRSEGTLSSISRLVFSSSAGAAGSSSYASLLSNIGSPTWRRRLPRPDRCASHRCSPLTPVVRRTNSTPAASLSSAWPCADRSLAQQSVWLHLFVAGNDQSWLTISHSRRVRVSYPQLPSSSPSLCRKQRLAMAGILAWPPCTCLYSPAASSSLIWRTTGLHAIRRTCPRCGTDIDRVENEYALAILWPRVRGRGREPKPSAPGVDLETVSECINEFLFTTKMRCREWSLEPPQNSMTGLYISYLPCQPSPP